MYQGSLDSGPFWHLVSHHASTDHQRPAGMDDDAQGQEGCPGCESKRKEGVRNAVELAAAAYEEAKKVLKKASADRRAAVKASNDPPPSVGVCLPVIECIDYTLAIHIVYKGCCWSEASIRHRLCALLAGSFKHL